MMIKEDSILHDDLKRLRNKPDGFIKDTIIAFLKHNIYYDTSNIFLVPIEELLQYKIQTRTRDNSRSGSIRLDYNSRNKKEFREQYPDEFYGGQDKWDKLYTKMSKDGWLNTNPAEFMIRRHKKSRLWDGHHRLFIAKELNLDKIPLRFKYRF